jgi:hypothetical protein
MPLAAPLHSMSACSGGSALPPGRRRRHGRLREQHEQADDRHRKRPVLHRHPEELVALVEQHRLVGLGVDQLARRLAVELAPDEPVGRGAGEDAERDGRRQPLAVPDGAEQALEQQRDRHGGDEHDGHHQETKTRPDKNHLLLPLAVGAAFFKKGEVSVTARNSFQFGHGLWRFFRDGRD